MPPIATFAGVDAKLRRADVHMKAVHAEIAKFLGSNPYRIITEYDPAKMEVVAKAREVVTLDVDLLACLIGDCVHNLRSALDHLAHQLLRLGGGTPRIGRTGTAFPIIDSFHGPRGGPRTVDIVGLAGSVTPPVLAFVQGVQPRERVGDEHAHPLYVLSELDNMDKHRELTTTATRMQDFSLGIVHMEGVGSLYVEFVGHAGPFDDTTELAKWRVSDLEPNAKMQVNHQGTIDIALDATTGPAANQPVEMVLADLSEYVSNIVEVLKWLGFKTAVP